MASSDLRQFISLLEANGELSRISVSVDPVLEIAAITNRVCKQTQGSAALLFVTADAEPNELSRAVWRAINVTDFTDDIFQTEPPAVLQLIRPAVVCPVRG